MKKNIKAITDAGIIAALYLVITIISVYFYNLTSIGCLIIMPIFIAYYSSVYNFKETLLTNLAIVITTLLIGFVDPLYSLFYVIPSLLIGDLYGFLNKRNVGYYTTIFLQTITFSITNILSVILAEIIYETKIIEFIINDDLIIENFSFSILFILSGAEAVLSTMFISEKLKKLNIIKNVEKKMPLYAYIAILSLFLLSVAFFFINHNVYFLLLTMTCIISIPVFADIFNKLKGKPLFSIAIIFSLVSSSYLLCFFKLYQLIPMIFMLVLFVYSIVKIINYIYNINTYKEK